MSSSRRSVLQAIAGLSVAVIAVAGALPVALRKMFDDAQDMTPSTELIVPSGETYTISSGNTETYTYAEIDGTLEAFGTLEVTDDG